MSTAAQAATQTRAPKSCLEVVIQESRRLRHEIEILTERARIWKIQQLVRQHDTQHDTMYGSGLPNSYALALGVWSSTSRARADDPHGCRTVGSR